MADCHYIHCIQGNDHLADLWNYKRIFNEDILNSLVCNNAKSIIRSMENGHYLVLYHSCSHIRDDNLALTTDIDLALDYGFRHSWDNDWSQAHGSYLGHLL